MNKILKYSAFSVLLAVMAGCAEDNITPEVGALPDETAMNIVGGRLLGTETLSNMITVSMYEDDAPKAEEIAYSLTKPTSAAITVQVAPSPDLVEKYNQDNGTELKEFPVANVTIEGDGTLTVPAGKKSSVPIKLTLSSKGLESGAPYLLAIALKQDAKGIEAQANKLVIYYRVGFFKNINVYQPTLDAPKEIPPLLPNVMTVVYVNTETYQPLIVNAYDIKRKDWINTQNTALYRIGNIVNLKKATIGNDIAGGRISLDLGSGLSYVLEHQNKYIRSIHDQRKLCLCIENGGKGIGFCNMSDMQIADFVRQVKNVIEHYNLDGVNLWDDDSGYGKAGMPEMNTTSYPKLIKALREALPSGKLLTLVDKGDATEYFYDTAKCGGIEVGKYIDYAWHGYCSDTEDIQLINPNDGTPQPYSKYTRRAIAGLNDSRYGNINAPNYAAGAETKDFRNNAPEFIAKWKLANLKKSNIMVYGSDFIGSEYNYNGKNHEYGMMTLGFISSFMDDGDYWDESLGMLGFLNDASYSSVIIDMSLNGGPEMNLYRKDW